MDETPVVIGDGPDLSVEAREPGQVLVLGPEDRAVIGVEVGSTTTPVALVGAPETSTLEVMPPESPPVIEVVAGQGPRGIPGAAVSSYVHDQLVPSDTWTVQHNLEMYPNVTVQDSAGTNVFGQISYVDRNTLILTFSAAFAGRAYLS